MKRKIRKLALTKETLRTLEEGSLSNAAGGATELGAATCPIMSCQYECTNVTKRCSVCCQA
jgi:hypothetical protein